MTTDQPMVGAQQKRAAHAIAIVLCFSGVAAGRLGRHCAQIAARYCILGAGPRRARVTCLSLGHTERCKRVSALACLWPDILQLSVPGRALA